MNTFTGKTVNCEFGRGKTIIGEPEANQLADPNTTSLVCKAVYCPIIICEL